MNPEPRPQRPDAADLSDAELAARLQLGLDADAFAVLVLRYSLLIVSWVRCLARRVALLPGTLADAQQDAVFAIPQAARRYRADRPGPTAPCTFRTFLRCVVRDRFHDFVRRQQRVRRHEIPWEGAALEEDRWRLCPSALGDADTDPVATLQAAEEAEQVRRFLEDLSPPERTLWELKADGWRCRKIAAVLGLSEQGVVRRWRRLLARLRSTVAELRTELRT